MITPLKTAPGVAKAKHRPPTAFKALVKTVQIERVGRKDDGKKRGFIVCSKDIMLSNEQIYLPHFINQG